MEKEFVKVLIKNHHDVKEDLISRPLVRAYNKLDGNGIKNLITDNGIWLYGYMKDGKFYELFTDNLIDINIPSYIKVSAKEVEDIKTSLTNEELAKIFVLIQKFIFGLDVKVDFLEVSTMEEKACDRNVLLGEYHRGLTDINPYDKEDPMAYNRSLVERHRR